MHEKSTKQALTRLRRIEGQIRGVHRMIEEDRYCVDVLTQTRAIVAALHGVEDIVMENHLNTCVVDAIRSDDPEEKSEKIDKVLNVITKFRKGG